MYIQEIATNASSPPPKSYKTIVSTRLFQQFFEGTRAFRKKSLQIFGSGSGGDERCAPQINRNTTSSNWDEKKKEKKKNRLPEGSAWPFRILFRLKANKERERVNTGQLFCFAFSYTRKFWTSSQYFKNAPSQMLQVSAFVRGVQRRDKLYNQQWASLEVCNTASFIPTQLCQQWNAVEINVRSCRSLTFPAFLGFQEFQFASIVF